MSHPAPKSPPAQAEPTRRSFFGALTWLMGGLAAVFVALPYVSYLLGPVLRKKTAEVPLGLLKDWEKTPGETRWVTFDNPLKTPWDGMTANTGVYVRYLGIDRDGKPDFWVFAVNCAHLGCPVTWFPQSGLFMCPCHGGVYYEDGERASGPPPRGLYKCDWSVKNGQLVIKPPHFPTLQDILDPKRDREQA